MSAPLRIEQMYAFVAVDQNGDEGVMAFKHGDQWMPMVCADLRRVDSLRPIAQAICAASRKSGRLVRFTTREDVETIGGGG